MLLANITQRNYWTKNYEIMDMAKNALQQEWGNFPFVN